MGNLDALSSKITSLHELADCYYQMHSIEYQVLSAFFADILWYQKQKNKELFKRARTYYGIIFGDGDTSHNLHGLSKLL